MPIPCGAPLIEPFTILRIVINPLMVWQSNSCSFSQGRYFRSFKTSESPYFQSAVDYRTDGRTVQAINLVFQTRQHPTDLAIAPFGYSQLQQALA